MSRPKDPAIVEATSRVMGRDGGPGMQATVTGSHFEGGCSACRVPTVGGVVVLVELGGADRLSVRFRLCADHFNVMRGVLERVAPVRDI